MNRFAAPTRPRRSTCVVRDEGAEPGVGLGGELAGPYLVAVGIVSAQERVVYGGSGRDAVYPPT